MTKQFMKYLISLFSILLLFVCFDQDGIQRHLNGRLAGQLVRLQDEGLESFSFLNSYIGTSEAEQAAYMKLKGLKRWSPIRNFEFNQYAYENYIDIPEDAEWSYYLSAPRIHYVIASFIDQFFYQLFGLHDNSIRINIILSFLSTVALFLFLTWVFQEFGLPVAGLTSLLLAVSSPFNFGNTTFYWMQIAPFIYLLFTKRRQRTSEDPIALRKLVPFGLLFFVACLMSYEMVPTIALSALVPSIYYFSKSNPPLTIWFKETSRITMTIMLSFLAAFTSHYYMVKGHFGQHSATIAYFKKRFVMRTYDFDKNVSTKLVEPLQEALNTSLIDVLISFNLKSKGILGLPEYQILLTSLGLFLVLFLLNKKKKQSKQLALVCVLVISFIGALARVIIFKSHGARPAHQEFITSSFTVPFHLIAILILSYFINLSFQSLALSLSSQKS